MVLHPYISDNYFRNKYKEFQQDKERQIVYFLKFPSAPGITTEKLKPACDLGRVKLFSF